ncbi:hypothetical protein [Alteromonas flava]|uniref:hypothetical protein n=1 Tax=Alteromonas flava TaxID=2048003 RepID=UPI000C28C5C1|nr:hypothetical protein [Alteromonas flava]
MDSLDFDQFLNVTRKYYSGDNCQPLQFSLEGEQIVVHYRADIAKHTLVYDYQTLIITLGGALEYARNALAAQGFNNVSVNLDNKLLATIDVTKDAPSLCSLSIGQATFALPSVPLAVLANRHTDRRPYVALTHFDHEAQIQSPLTYVNSRVKTSLEPALLEFFAWSDSQVWRSRQLGLDILNAVDFSSDEPECGLPKKNLGVGAAELLPIKLIQRFPGLFNVFAAIGAQKGMQKSQLALWKSAQSCLIFTVPKNASVADKLFASVEMMHTILQLSAQGYSMQPSTLSTEILNLPVKQDQANLSAAAGIDFAADMERINSVRQALDIGADTQILWLLRLGKTDTAFPDDAKTGRRNITSLKA